MQALAMVDGSVCVRAFSKLPGFVFAPALDDSAMQPLEVWFLVMTRSDMPRPVHDDIGSEKRERRHGSKVTSGAHVPHDELLSPRSPLGFSSTLGLLATARQ